MSYLETLAMQLEISYISYSISSHEQTGNIIDFENFEEGNCLENGRNIKKDESILSSIY